MLTFSSRSLAATLLVLSLPLAATAATQTEGGMIQGTDGTIVQLRRVYTTREREAYNKAIAIYNAYLQLGITGLKKPDINMRSTIDFYLKNPVVPNVDVTPVVTDHVSTKDYMKPEEDVIPIDSLTKQERAELTRAQKIGKCWNYIGFSKNYLKLCQQFIKGKVLARTIGLQSDLVKTRATGRAAISSASSSSVAPLTIKGYQYRSLIRVLPRARGRSSRSSSASSSQ